MYFTVGFYENGSPAELFLVLGKSGEALAGMGRCFATCFSMCLQMGVPIEHLVEKFKYFRFEPAGLTDNPQIPKADSVVDYIAKWIEATFLVPRDSYTPAPLINLRPETGNDPRSAPVAVQLDKVSRARQD